MTKIGPRIATAALALITLAGAACQEGLSAPELQQGSLTDMNGEPSESAAELTCEAEITGGTYGNIVVESGEVCSLAGTVVEGNIEVKEGGAFLVADSRIYGNVQASGATYIWIQTSWVDGDVQVDNTTGVYEHAANLICGSEIGGNVQLEKNLAPFALIPCDVEGQQRNVVHGDIQITDNYLSKEFDSGFDYAWAFDLSYNEVAGNLQFMNNQDNERSAGGHNIYQNVIGENLQCQDNSPAPSGGGNTVGGNAEGQCYALATDM